MIMRDIKTGKEYTVNPIIEREGWFIVLETGEKIPRHQLRDRFIQIEDNVVENRSDRDG